MHDRTEQQGDAMHGTRTVQAFTGVWEKGLCREAPFFGSRGAAPRAAACGAAR
ncbi:hypothetical protein [Xanthomonas maliensis]|uniref:hypothetical protein n=1 Tax=Xanthomonas maliensis TaxID=1321368 RepID=UPI0003A929DD|nr:hypothetical protein [Xanthomonas maliensis]